MAKPSKSSESNFTGIARSLVCETNNNTFKNYRIVTFHILNGVIVSEQRSDMFMLVEALAKLDRANEESSFRLNNRWADGLGMRDFDQKTEPLLPADPIGGKLK